MKTRIETQPPRRYREQLPAADEARIGRITFCPPRSACDSSGATWTDSAGDSPRYAAARSARDSSGATWTDHPLAVEQRLPSRHHRPLDGATVTLFFGILPRAAGRNRPETTLTLAPFRHL